MIILTRDKFFKENDTDCTYKVVSGDLVSHVKRIGYSTTFDEVSDPVTDEDIKDLYIYACWNEDDDTTLVFISIREDWDLIFVGNKSGNYVGNGNVVMSTINAWINNN